MRSADTVTATPSWLARASKAWRAAMVRIGILFATVGGAVPPRVMLAGVASLRVVNIAFDGEGWMAGTGPAMTAVYGASQLFGPGSLRSASGGRKERLKTSSTFGVLFSSKASPICAMALAMRSSETSPAPSFSVSGVSICAL